MKTPKILIILIGALAAIGVMKPASARAEVSVNFFYVSLEPYGEWVQTDDYGYCWHPRDVDERWSPYTDGYWANTDEGWTWVSYEDYGGIVYHYGRWTRIPGEGWVWVPGDTWAPAWVSWRQNDDYVGWAPLPPEAHWRAGIGFSTWVDAHFDIGPACFSFVAVRDFGEPALGPVIVNREQNVTIINRTTNITNITTINNNNVYVGGPRYETIARRVARPIPTLKLVRQGDVSSIAPGGKILSRQQGNQLTVIAPRITPSTGRVAPAHVAKTLGKTEADHGWNGIKDPQQRDALRTKLKGEGGKDMAAARPVSQEEIKSVQQRIKSQPAPQPLAGPATATGKQTKEGKASRTPATEDLINAPATGSDQAASGATGAVAPKPGKHAKGSKIGAPQGASAAGSDLTAADTTPKPAKGTKGKAHSASQQDYLNAAHTNSGTPGSDLSAEPTPPTPKTGKGKKSHADYANPYDSAAPVGKHARSTDSSLQPFMGDQPKPRKHTENVNPYDAGYPEPKQPKYTEPKQPKYTEPKSSEPRYSEPKGYGGADVPRQKAPKGEKGDKKGKGEQTPNPYGQ